MTDTSRLQIILLALVLFLTGVGIAFYKNIALGFPLVPDQYADLWTLEAKISFSPTDTDTETQVLFSNPEPEAGWLITDEHITSSGFQLSIDLDTSPAKIIWKKSYVERPTNLFYKLQLFKADKAPLDLPAAPPLKTLELTEPQYLALKETLDVIEDANTSAKPLTLAALNYLNTHPTANFSLTSQTSRLDALQNILNVANIPSQIIRGVYLEDGRRRQKLNTLLASYEEQWRIYDIDTGEEGLPDNFFIWQRGEETVLDVIGGHNSKLEFAIVKNSMPLKTLILQRQRTDEDVVLDFSIYSLPVEQQGVYKNILLIPVGALIVALLRIFVGIRTSGTFMPILIALALIETTLLTGLTIFLAVVGIGLWIRNYLSHLNLLLVARVSAVVIMVILLMVCLSIASYKLGIDQALTVTFFPTIILAWTIERMSILWEEEGGQEVLIQGGGSLLAAILAFFAMTNPYIKHLTFNFPELLISLLGVIILLGNYSGYRLLELYRFRQLDKPD